ncbi:MFS transporter [Leptospira ilyithenensis]|uniref:MFS transporter n=1 Tax=Leptospira ilyithenensis TaxID=2484901 RepID=A0A4R9LMM3_9LEPT|nr:MFS transporter [Leptospira ilyithenensis]TGN07937.1 MFS transporter [Leptospira ilyithenensis]
MIVTFQNKKATDLQILLPLVLIVFTGVLSLGIPLSILAVHVKETLGLDSFWGGVVIGVESLFAVLFRPYIGNFLDTKGPKNAILLGLVVSSFSGIFYLLSSFYLDSAFLALSIMILGSSFLGIGQGALISGALAWGIGSVDPKNSGKAMVWCGIAMYGAIGVGSPIGMNLLEFYGFKVLSFGILFLPLLALGFAFRLRPVYAIAGKKVSFWTVVYKVCGPGLGLFLSGLGFGTIAGFINLYFMSRGWENGSIAMIVFGGCYIGTRLFFSGLPDRFGGAQVAFISLFIEAFGQLLICYSSSPYLAFVGSGLTGIGYSFVFPAFGIEAVKRVGPQNRGSAIGAYSAFFDISLGISAPTVGLIVNYFQYESAYLFGGIGSLMGVLIAWKMIMDQKRLEIANS